MNWLPYFPEKKKIVKKTKSKLGLSLKEQITSVQCCKTDCEETSNEKLQITSIVCQSSWRINYYCIQQLFEIKIPIYQLHIIFPNLVYLQ